MLGDLPLLHQNILPEGIPYPMDHLSGRIEFQSKKQVSITKKDIVRLRISMSRNTFLCDISMHVNGQL